MEWGDGWRKLHTHGGHRQASKFHINAGRWGNDVMYSYQMRALNVYCMSNTRPHAHLHVARCLFLWCFYPWMHVDSLRCSASVLCDGACIFMPSLEQLSVCWRVQSALSSCVYPRPQSMTLFVARVGRKSMTGAELLLVGVWLRVEVIRSEGEQVVAAYFRLVHPSLRPSCVQPRPPLLQWQRSKVGPGKGRWLRARDIPAFLCRLNRSQHGLSLEINGPQCYLNTRWPQGRRGFSGGSQQPHRWQRTPLSNNKYGPFLSRPRWHPSS